MMPIAAYSRIASGSPRLALRAGPYTPSVPSPTIAESLPYINWTVLVGLALGVLALANVLRQTTEATRGFLGFSAFCAGLLALLALASDGSLPTPTDLAITANPQLDPMRRVFLGVFVVLAFASSIQLLRRRRALWLGLLALAAGVLAEAIAAIGWAGDALRGVPLLIQMLMLSAVTGGSLGSVVLAHWYLVTPRLSERPLILTTRLLGWALGLQLLLFLTWQLVGGPPGPAFSAFTGPQALFVWLRLSVGILFPLVLSYLAYRTAQTRSMESATGLLYIDLAAILSSTIVAAALYYVAGLLV